MSTETENKLQTIQPTITSVETFGSKETFTHYWNVATAFSKSDLVPTTYKGKVENCVIALEVANRLKASPLMVMQHLYIVQGKPAWSSQFLIATLNASNKFSPLRYEEDEKRDEGSTRAYAIDKLNGETIYGAWVSMKMAKAEGWVDKSGSKWKTMPEIMRRYRAASFFVKQFAPEISMGLMTEEEAEYSSFDEVTENANKTVLSIPAIAATAEKQPVVDEKKEVPKQEIKPNPKAETKPELKAEPATATQVNSESNGQIAAKF
jgi:hypothetical protein